MKLKNLFLTIAFAFSAMAASAQPSGFNYQAVVRNAQGELVTNTKVSLRLTLGNENGSTVNYRETQTASTNAYGVLSVTVGAGKADGGKTLNDVDWASGNIWLHIEIDTKGGTNYTDLGATKLQAVPYAYYALNEKKPTTSASSDALFEVKDKDGNVIFAVYPEGVYVYVDDADKSNDKVLRSGFVVKGRSNTKDDGKDYFAINADGTQVFVDPGGDDKVLRSGFVVKGRSATKGGENTDLLTIDNTGTKVIIDNDDKSKVLRSGFVVKGRSNTKDDANYFEVGTEGTQVQFDTDASKVLRSGFVVKGRSNTKGTNDYFNIDATQTAKTLNGVNRVYWYPEKNAFMAGNLKVDSAAQVGTNSFNAGFQNKAIGEYSQALGYKSIAKGNYTTAIGREAKADKENAYAFGNEAQAKGEGSYAIGAGAIASGTSSYALGSVGKDSLGNWLPAAAATGDFAYAIGAGTVAEGKGSTALGVYTRASGEYSTAMGIGSVASGGGSLAIGNGATATMWNSVSIGYNTTASESQALAIGNQTTASGWCSFAMGNKSMAKGGNSVAIGDSAITDEYGAIAMGQKTTATGWASLAMGYESLASNWNSVAIGYRDTASGAQSVAMGAESTASGAWSVAMGTATTAGDTSAFAMGCNTTAKGWGSVAMGFESTASGNTSVAMGRQTQASGKHSFAIGEKTTANGRASVAMGEGTTTNEDCAIAMGSNTAANGYCSVAIGRGAIANGGGSFALGENTATGADCWNSLAFGHGTIANVSDEVATGRFNTGDRALFVVGNGGVGWDEATQSHTTDTTRSDAFIIYEDGNAKFFGNLAYAGELNKDSDSRLKKDVKTINGALDKVLKLRGVNYYWKNREEMAAARGKDANNMSYGYSDKLQTGVIAQEVEQIMPELVSTDKYGFKSVDYVSLTPVLIEAIKELKAEKDALETKVDRLEKMMEELLNKQ